MAALQVSRSGAMAASAFITAIFQNVALSHGRRTASLAPGDRTGAIMKRRARRRIYAVKRQRIKRRDFSCASVSGSAGAHQPNRKRRVAQKAGACGGALLTGMALWITRRTCLILPLCCSAIV